MRTVFFGPWVGELGWELLHWQGWVRKVCREEFREYRKVAVSFPGREPLYPGADQFCGWGGQALEEYRSGRDYLTDGWRDGMPKGASEAGDGNFERIAERHLREYREWAPEQTEFFVPFHRNEHSGMVFGVEEVQSERRPFRARPIPLSQQVFEKLRPTDRGTEALGALLSCPGRLGKRLVCLLPRSRSIRRPDKNWPPERYLVLVKGIQKRYPNLLVAIVGAPGGALFANGGCPEGCLDLTWGTHRLDVQVAALNRAVLALGGMSGAIMLAQMSGCPTLTWGFPEAAHSYHEANVLGTPFQYHPALDVSAETALDLASKLIEGA